jgi:hypothetical protein
MLSLYGVPSVLGGPNIALRGLIEALRGPIGALLRTLWGSYWEATGDPIPLGP